MKQTFLTKQYDAQPFIDGQGGEGKHTPGNWRPVYVMGVCIGVGVGEDNEVKEMICNSILPDFDKDYEKDKQEIEANMELTARAPELLSQLNAAKEELQSYKEAYEDKERIAKEMDVFINGDDAAEQPALIDVFCSVREMKSQLILAKAEADALRRENAELKAMVTKNDFDRTNTQEDINDWDR